MTSRGLLAFFLGLALALTVGVAFAEPLPLRWQAPTENVDGTPLTNLAGYRVYLGASSRTYTDIYEVPDPAATSVVLDVPLPVGPGESVQFFVAMTAYDATGAESEYSNEVVMTVTANPNPNPPTDVEVDPVGVSIDCPAGYTCVVTVTSSP